MSVQVYFLAIKQVDPPQTVTRIEEVKFDEIDFPILFKVCFKTAFHSEKLEDTGYKNIWGFFREKASTTDLSWAGLGILKMGEWYQVIKVTNDSFILNLVYLSYSRNPREAIH